MTDPDTIPTATIRSALRAAFPEVITTEATVDEMLTTASRAFSQLSTVTGIVFAGFARIDQELRAIGGPPTTPDAQQDDGA